MGNYEVLACRFAEANLRAEVIERQIQRVSSWTSGASASDVFRMTILGRRREEYFRIWPGARTNRVEVEGIDRERRQLVLMVHEPVRTFEERLPKSRVKLDPARVKVVREDRYFTWIEHRTDARSATSCAAGTSGSCSSACCHARPRRSGTPTRCSGRRR